jgi:lipoprotein-anchoring transpeptidase ErfK/SrfK
VTALAQLNGISDQHHVVAGQTLRIPIRSAAVSAVLPSGPTAAAHFVQPGEPLSAIAFRYGVTSRALIQATPMVNPPLIHAGPALTIPVRAAAPTGGGSKRILVDLSEQHLYAYQGETLVYSFVASTGMSSSPTRSGTFQVLDKIPNAYASAWDLQMPYWLGIYWAGTIENGIHALPILSNGQTLWAGYLGSPVSYGCVVLGTDEARLLYEWAEIGTPVVIRY